MSNDGRGREVPPATRAGTAATPLRVYVSSTIKDLEQHRAEVLRVISAMGATPVAIEDFVTSEASPIDICRRAIRASDVVLVIVANRYGAVFPDANVSATEFEYSEARRLQIPVHVFLLNENYPWFEKSPADQESRLARFKALLQAGHFVTFTSPTDLGLKVAAVLAEQDNGLLPPPAISASDELVTRMEEHFRSLRSELAAIQTQLELTSRRALGPPASAAVSARPPAFLGPGSEAVKPFVCFIAMPYSREWSRRVREAIEETCRGEGFTAVLASEMNGRFVAHDIWTGITGAGVIIADLSGGNPNVAYELGLADMLGKEVILICQGNTVPFDFLGHRLIIYEDSAAGDLTLREELAVRLRRLRATSATAQ